MLMGGNNVTRKTTLDGKDLLQCKLNFLKNTFFNDLLLIYYIMQQSNGDFFVVVNVIVQIWIVLYCLELCFFFIFLLYKIWFKQILYSASYVLASYPILKAYLKEVLYSRNTTECFVLLCIYHTRTSYIVYLIRLWRILYPSFQIILQLSFSSDICLVELEFSKIIYLVQHYSILFPDQPSRAGLATSDNATTYLRRLMSNETR